MKIVMANNGKKQLSFTKVDWQRIGSDAGWLEEAIAKRDEAKKDNEITQNLQNLYKFVKRNESIAPSWKRYLIETRFSRQHFESIILKLDDIVCRFIAQTLVKNEHCPIDLVKHVIDYAVEHIKEGIELIIAVSFNPNISLDDSIKMVDILMLNRNNGSMSRLFETSNAIVQIMENNNFPMELRIKYMKQLGKISKENPKKHILEDTKENEITENKESDLDQFRNLLNG